VILRAIIDQHDFERFTGSLHHRFQAVVEIGNVLLLVVERDDEWSTWARLFIIAETSSQFRKPVLSSQFSVPSWLSHAFLLRLRTGN